MARRFSAVNLHPDLLVSSSAKRAVETAEAYARTLDISSEAIQINKDIFEAERAEILRAVHALDDCAGTVVLFAHHPGVTNLLHHLVHSEVEKMPLGAFALLELSAESWRTVSFKKGRLIQYEIPKEKSEPHGWWWQFAFWRRQRMQKVELFTVFLAGLLLILGIIALIVRSSTDSAGMPQQGSMGRHYGNE